MKTDKFQEDKAYFQKCLEDFKNGKTLVLSHEDIWKQIDSHTKAIPFDLSIPSDELNGRVKNIKADKNKKVYKTVNELFEDLDISNDKPPNEDRIEEFSGIWKDRDKK